jgi:hypothetical protein
VGPALRFWRDFPQCQVIFQVIRTGSLALPVTGLITTGPRERLPRAHAGSARNPALPSIS